MHSPPANITANSARQEPRWTGAAALAIVAALRWVLPPSLAAGPDWFAMAAIGVLVIAAYLLPHWHDQCGYAASAIVTLVLGSALYRLLVDLIAHQGKPSELLFGSLVIWSMNIIVFATWYWRLDAGGPRERRRGASYEDGAFLFPQLTLKNKNNWHPRFIDYLFLAFNTSTAFSPTDVPVLSPWAKVLMMVQSSISLMTLAVVAARAVNIL